MDGATAFITSANFTESAHERNIELGVLFRDNSKCCGVDPVEVRESYSEWISEAVACGLNGRNTRHDKEYGVPDLYVYQTK